jgi:hypothetical protein
VQNLEPWVLLSTATSNTGIDQVLLVHVLRVRLPCCVTTMIKERGNDAPQKGMQVLFVALTNRSMFVKLLLTILLLPQLETEKPLDHKFVNLTIMACSPEGYAQQETTMAPKKLWS